MDYCTTTRAAPGEMQVNYNYYLITTLDTQQSWVCHSSHTSTFLFTMSCGQYTEICGHFYARKGDASSSPISRIHSACIGAHAPQCTGTARTWQAAVGCRTVCCNSGTRQVWELTAGTGQLQAKCPTLDSRYALTANTPHLNTQTPSAGDDYTAHVS